MPNTRQEILDTLGERDTATVRELAKVVNLTPMSVRHHLQALREEGLVAVAGPAPPSGVGRPQQLYALVPWPAEDSQLDYRLLLASLLEEAEDLLSQEELLDSLRATVDRLIAGERPQLESLSPGRRVREVTAYLSRRGHLARWERAEDGYLLHSYNCPFHPLARLHPVLCKMDRDLIAGLLRQPVRPVASILEHHGRCTFHVMPPRAAGTSLPAAAV